MKPFHDIHASHLTSSSLRDEIDSNGYVLIRDALPLKTVSSVLSEVTRVLNTEGWLLPQHDPMEHIANEDAACGDPDPAFKRVYQEIFNLELFHALPHQPSLQRVMKMLVGDQLLIHPKPIGRLIFPRCERLVVHAHQDYQLWEGIRSSTPRGFHFMTAPPTSVLCGFWRALTDLAFNATKKRICMFQRF